MEVVINMKIVNPYYNLIKLSCENYSDDDKKQWIGNDTIFPDWDEPYEIIRQHLEMTEEEFKNYKESKSDSFDDEYRTFVDAEQMLLKEFANELY